MGEISVTILLNILLVRMQLLKDESARSTGTRANLQNTQAGRSLRLSSLIQIGYNRIGQESIKEVGCSIVLVNSFEQFHRRLGEQDSRGRNLTGQNLRKSLQSCFYQYDQGFQVGIGQPCCFLALPFMPSPLVV